MLLKLCIFGCAIENKGSVTPPSQQKKSIPLQKITVKDKKESLQILKTIRILSSKGEKAYRRKNYKSAEIFFKKALKLDPKNLHVLTGIGWTFYDSRQFKRSLIFFKKANKKYPKDGSAKRGLGYLFYRNGEFKKAKKVLGILDINKWPELAQLDLEKKLSPKNEVLDLHKIFSKRKGLLKYQSLRNRKKDSMELARPTDLNMVLISDGELYTSSLSRLSKRKKKRKKIKISSFLMDKFEVTNSQYAIFVKLSGYPEPPFWDSEQFSGANLPVVGVSWFEAKAFCSWAKKRLPTEAEWSYAAKSGLQERVYPWGMKLQQRNAIFGLDLISGGPKAVGRRPQGASMHGVEDLAGNVWEWVQEKYNRGNGKIYSKTTNASVLRVLKGGSWANGSWALKNFNRTGDLADRKLPVYGFRCVKSNKN